MIEIINYILAFLAIGLFLYFMWTDTKPLNHK